MLDKTDLIEAIGHYEDHIKDIKDCEALASLYTIYDHKYKAKDSEPICELIIQVDTTTRFQNITRRVSEAGVPKSNNEHPMATNAFMPKDKGEQGKRPIKTKILFTTILYK